MQTISLSMFCSRIFNMSYTEKAFFLQAYRQRFLANVTPVRLITVEQKIYFLVI